MIYGIVPAAGSGTRMRLETGSDEKKQFLAFGDGSVLSTTVHALVATELLSGIIIAAPPDDVAWLQDEATAWSGTIPIQVVAGGDERQASVMNALQHVPDDAEYVVIHDGVRPFVSRHVLQDVILAAYEYGAATVGLPITDTTKRVKADGSIVATVSRDALWTVQTPQVFRKRIIQQAHEHATVTQFQGTDDASLVEHMGLPCVVVKGERTNIKLTHADDLPLAKAWLRGKGE